MRLDAELLDGPPAAGARVMALARLGDAEAALARVADPADAEALHDLRVALRRLRATLKALAPLLGEAAGGKPRRRLAKAARLTGPARDAEVLLAWLGAQRDRLQAPWRGAHDWLLEKVERERARAAARVAGRAVPRLEKALPRLTARLSRPGPPAAAPPGAAAPATLGAALAPLLRARAAGLREALRSVAGPEDAAELHRARLEGKRLRYLLEPLRGVEGLGADEAVAALRRLQDLLGEWHDAHAAGLAIHAALAEAAADRARWRDRGGGDADFRPGLLALARLAAAREAALHARLEEAFLGAQATPLLDLAYAVVAALEARGAEAAPAPGRKLLLTALPPEVAGGRAEEVELGWLPGPRPSEGLGVVRGGGAERHLRLPPGRGAAAPLPRGDFEALWPLTDGRRVAKRCHRADAAPGWRFDEFLDRRLVLAVAEAGPDLEVPAWLEPVLVRDVTGERGYADEALARRPPRRAGA